MTERSRLKSTTFRLTTEARQLLAELAKIKGITLTAALEVSIREEARREGIKRPPATPDREGTQP